MNVKRPARFLQVCVALIGMLIYAASAEAQTRFLVAGRVLERGSGQRPVAGAVIRLADAYETTTDDTGGFEIRGVTPGRYALTVEALGYGIVQTTLVVYEDVIGTILMDPAPVSLDTLSVRPAAFDVRGRVVDRESQRSAAYVTVRIGDAETTTNDAGGFRLSDRLRGEHRLVVEGFGWLPFSTPINIDSDTVVLLTVDPDPITQRNIALQIERLSVRSRSLADSRYEIDRPAIMESAGASPIDILKSPGAVRIWECPDRPQLCVFVGSPPRPQVPLVCIDERRVHGLEALQSYPNAMLHRIEVVGGGRRIRAYTTRFIEQMIAGRINLQPFNPWGGC